MKWYTQTEYVSQQTGEVLNRQEAEQNYIIIKKEKNDTIKEEYGKPNWWTGTRKRETYGIRTITNVCTREGKQIEIW